MPNNGWTPMRLGDLVEIKHGWPFKSELYDEKREGRPIIVSVGNFRYTGGFRFEETSIKEYRGTYPKEYELAGGDILLIMTCQTAGGEILGIPAKVPNDANVYLHNQRLGKVVVRDTSRVDSGFLYQLFRSSEFNKELVISASGTKILHTAPSRIEAFQFDLPPLSEQRVIAHILGTLDDKIELNRRMNETLEAMARALFKSWFVDFDPVRAKAERRDSGLPKHIADLFPDSFEDSDLGEIPKRWKAQRFADTVDIIGGGTPKTSVAEYWGGDIPWFSVVDAPNNSDVWATDTAKKITSEGVQNSSTRILSTGTTIISARGTVGRIALVAVPMAMNQSCYGLRGKAGARGFYTYYATRELVIRLQQHAHGSVFDTITQETLTGVSLVSPPGSLIEAFEMRIGPALERIRANLLTSQTLAALRDALLPKLISGELQIDRKQKFPEAVG